MTIQGESRGPTILRLSNFDRGLRWLALFLFILPPATAQLPNVLPPPPPDPFSRLRFDRNMAIIMVVLVIIFFILGFLSVYTRQCADRRMRGRFDLTIPVGVGGRRSRGLDLNIIDTFPTFVYSAVKGLKMGRNTLECAVCLNEFQDDETLRLIPKCSHVFHPHCIDIWLGSHSTCPVCRANLIPRSGETSSIAVEIPNPCVGSQEPDSQEQHDIVDDNRNTVAAGHPNRNRPPRSRSTGFPIVGLLPRSHSTGHSLPVQPGENWERFTLRLPEEARKRLLNITVNRTNSCVEFTRESSERRGYRTRSVGSELGRSYLQYERLDSEVRPERWGFTMRPPFFSRNGSAASNKDDVDERSSNPLCPGRKD